jgi:prevent-host-death family protein
LARLDVATRPEQPDLPAFRLHPLKGELAGYWSITVRANCRILFRFEGDDVTDKAFGGGAETWLRLQMATTSRKLASTKATSTSSQHPGASSTNRTGDCAGIWRRAPRFRSDQRLTARPSGRRLITVAQTNLSKLVDRAATGEEIIIARAGKPKAKLVPYQPARKKRRFGQNLLGITYIADDFDRPLPPELQNYFE